MQENIIPYCSSPKNVLNQATDYRVKSSLSQLLKHRKAIFRRPLKSVYTANRVFIVLVALYCVKRYSKKKKMDSEILTP